MKNTIKICFASLFLGAPLASVNAANLLIGDEAVGISTSSGSALTSGILRFGTFSSGYDFAGNAGNLAALETAFTQVVEIAAADFSQIPTFPGFYPGGSVSFSSSSSYEGVPYDLSAGGSTANVAGDIAGELIYMWVLNAGQTEQAIFSKAGNFWIDGDIPADSAFGWDVTSGITAHIGSVSAGPDLGGGVSSHQLATVGAIPEPSRAVLGVIGLGFVFLRRRRA